MGYTILCKPEGVKTYDFIMRELFRDNMPEVLAHNISGKVLYAAIRGSNGDVYALVVLHQKVKEGTSNFAYKDMSEDMGPYYYGASAKVLDALSPTTNIYAIKWREQCRKHIAMKDALKKSSFVAVENPIRFRNGRCYRVFETYNGEVRYAMGMHGCMIPVKINKSTLFEASLYAVSYKEAHLIADANLESDNA